MIGAGFYQAATLNSALATGTDLALFHQCPEVAVEWKAAHPNGRAILRADHGVDHEQYDTRQSPEVAARWFYERFIIPQYVIVSPGTYWAALGPNESWPGQGDKTGLRWRADFELHLCRLVQERLGLHYIALSCSVGNLDPTDLPLFGPLWREAYAINYHGYLAPDARQLTDEPGPWHLYRPTALWAPELRRLGVGPWRLLYGECGTYYSPDRTGVSREDAARLSVAIEREMARRCQAIGVEWLGALAYGYGMTGRDGDPNDQRVWELAGTEKIIAEAAIVDRPPVAQGGSMPTVGAGFQKAEPFVGPWLEDEVYHAPGTPQETSLAIGTRGYAIWRKATNETTVVCDDGRLYADNGNRGNGHLVLLRPKA